VPDAPLAVKQHAHYVTRALAGRGAAREICELIMHAQGTLEQALAVYLK
jgi:3-deoxy-D-manno-octulosonate 8-phosphate phosphatase (KDO 8-P phosphatase)